MVGLTITRHETATGGEYRAHPADSEALGQLTWTTQAGNPAVHRADLVLVPSEIGGRGIAGRLVEAMVADARENHFRIEPLCSYVVAAFARHPEWADVRA
ncbi:MAG: GNAT family N-acetyltransferase [Pseudomonadota bacterium]|nr:GNAT family N-acetyltransferase [Pseudomonadota bacterium]